jgi:hypothetical protein
LKLDQSTTTPSLVCVTVVSLEEGWLTVALPLVTTPPTGLANATGEASNAIVAVPNSKIASKRFLTGGRAVGMQANTEISSCMVSPTEPQRAGLRL